jgi:hypothetical protein
MGDTVLASQTSANTAQFALDLLAANLDYHVTGSLARAHGLSAITFASPVNDANGNDVQYYRDSNGDIVGRYQLRFSANGVTYYAPGQSTALAGQDSSSGSLTETDVSALLGQVDKSALVTLFGEEVASEIQSVNDGILLPHTLLGHWEAHALPIVYPKSTTDAAGHVVGRNVAVLQVAGVKYEVPCDALGGPPKTIKFLGGYPTAAFIGPVNGKFVLQGNTLYMYVEAGEGWANSVNITYAITGTKPVTYLWQYSFDQVSWTDFTTGVAVSGAGSGGGKLTLTTANGGTVASNGIHTVNFAITSPGGDNRNTWYLRVVLTNAAGSVASVPIFADMKDEAAKYLCTLAAQHGYVSGEVLEADRTHALRLGRTVRSGYALWAKPASQWLRAHPRTLRFVSPVIAAWAKESAHMEGVGRGSLLGRLVYEIGRPICLAIGCLRDKFRSKDRN